MLIMRFEENELSFKIKQLLVTTPICLVDIQETRKVRLNAYSCIIIQ